MLLHLYQPEGKTRSIAMYHRVQKTEYRKSQACSRVPIGDKGLHYRDCYKWPLYVTVPLPYRLGTAHPGWQRKLFTCTSDKFCSHTHTGISVCTSMRESVRVQLAHVPSTGTQALGGTVRCGCTRTHGYVGLVGLHMEMASRSWFAAGKGFIYVCVS